MKLLSIFIFFTIVACSENKTKQVNNTNKYAKLFSIEQKDNYKKISIFSSKNKKEAEYYLSAQGSKSFVKDSDRLIILPVNRVICLSTTHIAFIDELGEADKIVGVSNKDFVFSPNIKNALDIGFEQNLNYEKIVALKPDIVFAYKINGINQFYLQKLAKLGIKVLIISEHEEMTPLARSEWLKLFATFFGKDSLAKSKFDKIEQNYRELKLLAKKSKERVKVLFNLPQNNFWQVPTSKSFIYKLVQDANGQSIFQNITSTQSSIPLKYEKAFLQAIDSDIWINVDKAKSKEFIVNIDKKLVNIKAFQKNKIFNNNNRLNKSGGNDFWESAVVKPDILLKDIIKIIHPELLQNYKLYFYQKIN